MASTHDAKRRALGRGLESLLPPRSVPALEPATPAGSTPAALPEISAGAAESTGQPLEIPVERIERNPFQTRTSFDEAQLAELTTSIAATGVIQPIVVRPLAEDRYQLIMGERRLLASKRAGRSTIPAIVRVASDEQTLEMTIVENLQRADLNPMEQARAFGRLSHDFRMTQEQMARRTGKDRASVANFLRLLKLPEPVQAAVESGELSFGHARTLLALDSPETILEATGKVRELAMSVRQTEIYVAGLLDPEERPRRAAKAEPPRDPNVRDAEERLQRTLGLRVKIEDTRGRGRVIIEYARLEDFDHILAALGAADEAS